MKKLARRVVVADDVKLPGQAEGLVSVYVERFEKDRLNANFIIEPTVHFKENYPLHMAGTLLNINRGPTCKVRILNLFHYE
jgi:hypothetical protein